VPVPGSESVLQRNATTVFVKHRTGPPA
jgi:hypothetical protein